MPVTCCVAGCGSRGLRDTSINFHRIPATTDRRGREDEQKKRRQQAWLRVIGREDLVGTKLKNARVCSRHFIKGKPAGEDCETHPDWIPSKFLKAKNTKKSPTKPSPSAVKINRFRRSKERGRRVRKSHNVCAQ